MKLSILLEHIINKDIALPECKRQCLNYDPDITSIHYQSQTVKPGGLFVAIPGNKADGHDFIDDAIKRGAATLVVEKRMNTKAIEIKVQNSRKALSVLSNRFYNNPSEKLCVIGVTGTNGKTTTTYIIENILAKAGFKTGVLGTINYRHSGKIFKAPMTTPESLDLQEILFEMFNEGITHVVMEVSSHAIDLCRVDNCYFDIGVFTNLTQDHLDFHKDMDTYWSCKKRLFTEILATGPKSGKAIAVINCSNDKGNELYKSCALKKISVGFSKDAYLSVSGFQGDLNGIFATIITPEEQIKIHSTLVGTYNMENILCAAGVGFALKLPGKTIKAGIEETGNVPGRLESVDNNSGKFIYIDYAHTPDALENVLTLLVNLKTKKMICIFGCGGDRDKDKRPVMGEIAGKFCDFIVITSDNPRTEEPMRIIRDIENGVKKTSPYNYSPDEFKEGIAEKGYTVEPDRQKAIRLGIRVANKGDIVLIAGKGHENYQILNNKIIEFDDRVIAKQAFLNNKLNEATL